jgi:SOS-response transcriptional repressor LexA
MENERERFNFIQKNTGLTKKDFAESLGISKAMGYQISRGMLKPSRETLGKLSSIYRVNLNWFLLGEGSPFETEKVSIKLLDQEAAAGRGMEIQDYAEEKTLKLPLSLISPYHPENLRAVYVKGDSMTGEHIHNGDAVVYCPGLTEGNGIYVLSLDTALLVKRVSFDDMPRSVSLISANPAYPTRQIAGLELENLKIEGRVVTCVHKVW